jgi:hypothetical protein
VAQGDTVQVERWAIIRQTVGRGLRSLRAGRSQAVLAGDIEDLGYRLSQSSVCRYEQGLVDAPLSRERLIGWALCGESLNAPAFRDLLTILGFGLTWDAQSLGALDQTLRHTRRLPLPDQVVVRRRLLWHLLGLEETDPEWTP